MDRIKRLLVGGSAGNQQLTAVIAAVLLLLLAIEGAILLRLTSLLTVHAFVGMLLIPVLGLKVASTGWRFLHYYRNGEEYVRPTSCKTAPRRTSASTHTRSLTPLHEASCRPG